MITIETQISGSQIGSKLAGDPEELAYALMEIADSASKGLANELQESIYGSENRDRVLAMLRNWATALEEN